MVYWGASTTALVVAGTPLKRWRHVPVTKSAKQGAIQMDERSLSTKNREIRNGIALTRFGLALLVFID